MCYWLVLPFLFFHVQSEQYTSAGGFDLRRFKDRTYTWEWANKQFIRESLCGTINSSCGISGQCIAPHCCAICQVWTTDGQEDGACLAKNFARVVYHADGRIALHYVNGDSVPAGPQGPAGPRAVNIFVECGREDFKFKFGSYYQAKAIGPDGAYTYNLTVSSTAFCVTCNTAKNCDSCAGTGCEWCLDTNSCASKSSNNNCRNFITNPNFCPPPPCSSKTCDGCLGSDACVWCVDGYCSDNSRKCRGGVVRDSKYCPKLP